MRAPEARLHERAIAGAPSSLNDASRRAGLDRATAGGEPIDVLVIGGGITGAGVALDAASRGLRTVLLEANDLAAGTSGVSSKLVHGGLRYLAKGDIAMAWESAVERKHLMTTIAPHLVRPLRFLIPNGEPGLAGRAGFALSAAGVGLADVLRRASGLSSTRLPGPRPVGRDGVLALSPAHRRDHLRGGLVYWDGQVEDDARLVLAVARTAASLGAGIIRDCRVTAASADRVSFRDERTGESGEIRAGIVINATGVWAGDLEPSITVTPSRGSHLVLDAARVGRPLAAVTMPVPGAFGRFLFALPQANGAVYFGLTDE
ncbi:FAD-dependent oxidoreductase, partial [Leucobacter sp. M11]|uniref:FAD-dependent oxidoreductase n=1 Tax=Leucobacter sp. M11 TaxID=2993565 RepID=UPI002D804F35